jgi:hypothetical protein
MSKNTLKATIPFSFKGVKHKPSVVIDLDEYVQKKTDFLFLSHLVANANNISNYSYEYEVLESSPVFFSDATGLAQEFLSDNQFDLKGFKQKLSQSKVLKALQLIAQQTLGIEDLDKNRDLKEALLKAYQAGKSS